MVAAAMLLGRAEARAAEPKEAALLPDTPPRLAPPGTRPQRARLPEGFVLPERNMFFPPSHAPEALPPFGPRRRVEAAEGARATFVLAGTIISSEQRVALLEYPQSGRVVWARAGDVVDGLTVARVSERSVAFELGGEELALSIGGGPEALAQGPRVVRGGFEVVGVCRGAGQAFALVQTEADGPVRRVHADDRLAAGRVLDIEDDAIVVEIGGQQRRVPVGRRFEPETRTQ
jgi:hypothetical protein